MCIRDRGREEGGREEEAQDGGVGEADRCQRMKEVIKCKKICNTAGKALGIKRGIEKTNWLAIPILCARTVDNNFAEQADQHRRNGCLHTNTGMTSTACDGTSHGSYSCLHLQRNSASGRSSQNPMRSGLGTHQCAHSISVPAIFDAQRPISIGSAA